ncbi:MAG: amidohydrolase family protein [Gemmatimonadetes bacterium]|nr:amidohydrolase family protein [Gemmatimonadota bacterium]
MTGPGVERTGLGESRRYGQPTDPISPHPAPPPAGTSVDGWDGHAHVIGERSRFPLWSGTRYDPAPAPLADYLRMLDRHGLARGVLVQPSAYGCDNSCMLDALDRAGGRLLGVAVPHAESAPRDLEQLHGRGVRGIRSNLLNPGGLAPETIVAWRPVLRELGWHVALHIDIGALDDLRSFVAQFGLPVVIDHMGRPEAGRTDPARPPLRALVELVRDGVCFVKLSAPYRMSAAPPPWRDVVALAHALLDANPDRCLFATDWPHVHTNAPIDTRDVFSALEDWCPDRESRRALLSRACALLLGSA